MTQCRQAENARSRRLLGVLPQVVESYDITAIRRLYSGVPKSEIGRRQWDGARIREIRDDRRLSQEALAEKARVSASDVSRHERNAQDSNPTVDVLVKIADALDVPAWSLLQPVGAPFPSPRKDGRGDGDMEAGSRVIDSGGERLAGYLRSLAGDLDVEHPAIENSWRGDVQKAIAALARALGRETPAAEPGDSAAKTGR
jgi:transcriptional regulator with XRE-family HTH domain